MGSAPSKPEQVFEVDEYGSLSLEGINALPNLTSYSNVNRLSINESTIDTFDLNLLPPKINEISIMNSTINRFNGEYNKYVNLRFSDMSMIPDMSENFSEGIIYIGYSDIQEIDLNTLPKNIDFLSIDRCPVENLVGSFEPFKKLTNMYIYKTKIKEIPDLPENLESFNFINNELISLPSLPKNLQDFNCSYNQIRELPEIPESVVSIKCISNQLTFLPELPKKLQELYCANNELTSLPKLPSTLEFLSIANNKLTKIPSLSKEISVDLCGNDIPDACNVATVDSSNISTEEYNGKEVKFITLRKGTIMFQSMRKLDSITLNFVGLVKNDKGTDGSYVINPEHRTYFFLHPFNTGYGGITVIYVLQQDIKLILGIKPSKIKGEQDIYRNYGQLCDKKEYKSLIESSNYKAYCLSDDFLQKFPDVYGWFSLGMNDRKKHYENSNIVKYGKYVSFYENDIGVIDRPEVAMYPFKERSLADVITPVSKVNYDFIVDNIDKYNYEPIIVLEENKSLYSYKRIIDRLLSDKGYEGYKIKRSSKDGLYYINE
jgi:Leucine-rich repeat (LRR) protein